MIYLYSLLTLAAFIVAIYIGKKWKSILTNTFVVTFVLVCAVVVWADLPYTDYMQGNRPFNELLPLSVVALALPLYEQQAAIRQHWKAILWVCVAGSFIALMTGILFAHWLGADPQLVASLLPKSSTMPIALVVSKQLDGVLAFTAMSVVVAGISGGALGYALLKMVGVKQEPSIGLAVGAVSHAIGTTTCMDANVTAGTFSSIALILCGLFTALLAPFGWWLLQFVM